MPIHNPARPSSGGNSATATALFCLEATEHLCKTERKKKSHRTGNAMREKSRKKTSHSNTEGSSWIEGQKASWLVLTTRPGWMMKTSQLRVLWVDPFFLLLAQVGIGKGNCVAAETEFRVEPLEDGGKEQTNGLRIIYSYFILLPLVLVPTFGTSWKWMGQ